MSALGWVVVIGLIWLLDHGSSISSNEAKIRKLEVEIKKIKGGGKQ